MTPWANGNVNSTQSKIQPSWVDPLGPSNSDPTGAKGLRTDIFGQLPGQTAKASEAAGATAGAATAAAGNAGWGDAAKLATDQINGKYLFGSPALDDAMAQMRSGSAASAANDNARIRSNYERNGMTFGTTSQEAEQNNNAVNQAGVNQAEAAAREQNYAGERQIQQGSTGMLNTALGSPVNYLQQAESDYLAPLSQEAQIVSGMTSGGASSHAQPDTVVTPGNVEQLLGSL